VLAYFDRPGTSNGPTEAINGRLEHLRGSALSFRNLINYIARSLLETGGFRPRLHPSILQSRQTRSAQVIRDGLDGLPADPTGSN
jgi:transposase